LIVLVVALAAMLTVGPWGPKARQERVQNQSVAVFNGFMNDWVTGESPNQAIGYVPAFFDQFLAQPANEKAYSILTNLWGQNTIDTAGVPYFAITKWVPLNDPVAHSDAAFGMTTCWVQGNLVTTPRLGSQNQGVTGPSPTAHVWNVFFKVTQGISLKATGPAEVKTLRIYDIADVTPSDGICPLG